MNKTILILLTSGCLFSQVRAQSSDPFLYFPYAAGNESQYREASTNEIVYTRYIDQGNNTEGTFTLLGRWGWGSCRAVELTDQFALVGQGYVYQVFDVTNPYCPTSVYDTTFTEKINHITLRDSILFLLLDRTVLLFNATSLYPLIEIGRFRTGGGFLIDMAVSDTLLFLLADFAGVITLSIANPTNPYFLEQFGIIDNFASAISSKEKYVYYQPIGPHPLYILEYVPDSSFRYNTMQVSVATSLYVSDSLLFLGNVLGELQVYDIVNPWVPQLLGSVSVGSSIVRIGKHGDRLYSVTLGSEIVIINVANPQQPVVVTRVPTELPQSRARLAISDSLFAAALHRGLKLYSITEPDSLRDQFYFATGGELEFPPCMRQNF